MDFLGRKARSEVATLEAERDALRSERDALASEVVRLGGAEKSDLLHDLARARGEAADLRWRLEDSMRRLKAAEDELDRMGRRVNDLQAKIANPDLEHDREVAALETELGDARVEIARAWESVEVAKILAEKPVREALKKLASYPVVMCQCGNVRNGQYKHCFVCGSDTISHRSGV